jgi:kynurenine 3-monooxygenase
MKPFVIVGAGLGGALMAALLGRAGQRVVLLERRPDPRRNPLDAGRSINLALSARGLHALSRIGLRDQILRSGTPLYGRMIHPVRGPLAYQPYGAKGQAIHSISRADLNSTLLDAAEAAGAVSLRFGRRVVALDAVSEAVTSFDTETGLDLQLHSGSVIGADGAYSAIRGELQRRERQDFSQAFLAHGYKELAIPPGPDGSHRLEPHALHIWPRGGYMMMAMANLDGSFTVTLYLAFEGGNSFAELGTAGQVEAFFERTFPDALALLPGLADSFFAHPTGTLVTIRTRPWQQDGVAVLLGDAAHAIVPFFGQGANAAFEDCIALAAALERHPDDRAIAFRAYETERRPNADAIAELALANFQEMRDQVASPLFRLEKRGEVFLHRLFPRWYLPLYTMISFTLIPYEQARARARRQKQVLRVIVGLFVVSLALWVAAVLAG